jgi:hypothetical protein
VAGRAATVRAITSAKKPGQIFLLTVMLEFLSFTHYGAPRLTAGSHPSEI